jgi:hypothetical protein
MAACCLRCSHGTLAPWPSDTYLDDSDHTRIGMACSRKGMGDSQACSIRVRSVCVESGLYALVECSHSINAMQYCPYATCRAFQAPVNLSDD